MPIGNTIKKLRQSKGWTQEELGERLGVKKSAIQKYESGQVQNLKRETIIQLCYLFETNPAHFLFEESDVKLAFDAELIERVKRNYGEELVELMKYFIDLDDEEKRKVIAYASDLEALQSLRNEKHLN